MAELSGETALALPELSVQDDARPDPGPDGHENERMGVPAGPMLPFAVGGHIGVVVDPERRVQNLLEGRDEVEAVEARVVGGMEDLPVPEAEEPGEPESGRRSSPMLFRSPCQNVAMRPIRSSMEPGLGVLSLKTMPPFVDEAVLELGPAEVESGVKPFAHRFFPMTA